MLFLRADLSQADSRIVYVKSHNPELIDIARRPPDKFDVHKLVGSYMFNCPESEVTGDKRQATKKLAHGTHYDEFPQRCSDSLLKDGYYVDVETCAVGQARYLKRFPAIKTGYQLGIRMQIIKTRQLVNSWGRVIRFPHERFEPSLYRRGYAWGAASEVADILNQWGFIPLDERIQEKNLDSRINMQVHDEVLVSTNPAECWDIACFLRDSIEREREYEGVALRMPVTFAIEKRYHSEEVEFKALPEKEVFMESFMHLWQTRIK